MNRILKIFTIVAGTICTCGNMALAEMTIGFYFDEGGTQVLLETPVFTPFVMYLVLLDPSTESITGFEASYIVDGINSSAFFIVEEDLFGGVNESATNTSVTGEWVLNWATPRPSTGATVLVSWRALVPDYNPHWVFLGPAAAQSINDGLPAIYSAEQILPVQYSDGDGRTAVAVINPEQVATRSLTWGSTKAVFR